MPDEVQIGKAIVFGATGQIDFWGAAKVAIQSSKLEDDFDKQVLKDENGAVIGKVGWNGNKKITIEMVPIGTTKADAVSQLKLPTKFARVTLSTFKMATLNSDKWHYAGGGSIEFNNENAAKISLPLELNDDFDPATVSAGP